MAKTKPLFKKPKTFEEGQKLRDKISEAFGETNGTFIIAFRVGDDLVSGMGGSYHEMTLMLAALAEKVMETI